MNAQTIDYDKLRKQVDAHPYPLVFATISGAHLYGFPSADSDFDLRGVHLLPLNQVVRLDPGEETVEKSGVHDGIEMDLVTHDAKKFFGLMLKKNGYVLEQLLSPLVVHTTPEHEELRAIAKDCITRFHGHHYLGFAATQWNLFRKEEPPKVKPLLYVYRVLLTGIHLMHTGEVEANLLHLNATAKLPYIDELIARKLVGAEKGRLDTADLDFHEREYGRLVRELETAMGASNLPEAAGGKEALNDLLVRLRRNGRLKKHASAAPEKKHPKLYLWSIRCIDSRSREYFDRLTCFDSSLGRSTEEVELAIAILQDTSKRGAMLRFRHLFREVTTEEADKLIAEACNREGSGFVEFSLPDYFEDENRVALQVTDVIERKHGVQGAVVLGNVDSVMRLPIDDMSAPSEWSVQASNDLAHFLQCVTILQQSRWWKSQSVLQRTDDCGPYRFDGPDLDSTTSALALIRQFLLKRDDVFRQAATLYLRQIKDATKGAWVEYELQRFEQFLAEEPQIPGLKGIPQTTNEELVDVVIYGTGLFHRKSNADLESKLARLSQQYARNLLMYSCDTACRQLLGPAMKVAPLLYRDFAHWSNSGQCPRPTRVVTARLFDAKD